MLAYLVLELMMVSIFLAKVFLSKSSVIFCIPFCSHYKPEALISEIV